VPKTQSSKCCNIRQTSKMGTPHSVLLDLPIKNCIDELYWPTPPHEGPIKVRYRCSDCKSEAILLNKEPVKWIDVVNLKGSCFSCKGKKVQTVFFESANEREELTYFGSNKDEDLAILLYELMRSRLPTDPSPENLSFKLVCRPSNFKGDSAFIWPEKVETMPLTIRKRLIDEVFINIKLHKPLLPWIVRIPSREPREFLAAACKNFLAASKDQLQSTMFIVFDQEEAVDLGGVSREFFLLASKLFLNPGYGLFVNSGPNGTYHPSPNSVVHPSCLDYFKFFGRLIGKAFFDGELIDANLTQAMFKLIAGQPIFFSDFQNVDRDLYMFLLKVYNYSEEELANSSLTFSCSVNDFSQNTTYELKPNGKNIEVTKKMLQSS